ncbi:5-oxoprolinase subunit PxpA [Rhodobacteraceae bacterium W635]|uniref:LamB/YcsF family protein n=1 Tax=Nioella halotolerans TaxID=2303578 RepID=UPI000E3C3A15|nr:5-oxoprolinase subunit PxpA [Rhodobacteraceae bacterium W635]
MAIRVDLNADMGESFGPWPMGRDAEVLKVVTSANVACGFHAGDPSVMAETIRLARDNGVSIGAHPGFPDLQGFGRRRMQMARGDLENAVRYQVGAIRGMAAADGASVRHIKLHGALANMCAEDEALARACYAAALSVDPGLTLYVLSGTAQETAAQALDATYAAEIFADRAYNDDATLVDRSQPRAVIHDAARAARRMVEIVRAGAIIAESGKVIPARVDTICLHGDNETALQIARAVRDGLEAEGVTLAPVTA